MKDFIFEYHRPNTKLNIYNLSVHCEHTAIFVLQIYNRRWNIRMEFKTSKSDALLICIMHWVKTILFNWSNHQTSLNRQEVHLTEGVLLQNNTAPPTCKMICYTNHVVNSYVSVICFPRNNEFPYHSWYKYSYLYNIIRNLTSV